MFYFSVGLFNVFFCAVGTLEFAVVCGSDRSRTLSRVVSKLRWRLWLSACVYVDCVMCVGVCVFLHTSQVVLS